MRVGGSGKSQQSHKLQKWVRVPYSAFWLSSALRMQLGPLTVIGGPFSFYSSPQIETLPQSEPGIGTVPSWGLRDLNLCGIVARTRLVCGDSFI
jgi:hypothetical protein